MTNLPTAVEMLNWMREDELQYQLSMVALLTEYAQEGRDAKESDA